MVIDDQYKDTLDDLKRGKIFIANDPHYRRERAKAILVDEKRNRLIVIYLKTGETGVLDLFKTLKGFDSMEYVWN